MGKEKKMPDSCCRGGRASEEEGPQPGPTWLHRGMICIQSKEKKTRKWLDILAVQRDCGYD
jgi:hypothetical protein